MDVVERTSHEIRVEADERDIHDFNDQWPASNLHGLEGVTFTFDAHNGDLIDLDYANGSSDEWDGPALLALSEDAQTAAGLSASHSPNRGHGQGDFAGGFAAAKADRAAGRTRQLCQSEHGVKPPVTKREDGTEYYHGYKAAAGGAQNELSAYMQYRAQHRRTSGMQTNGAGEWRVNFGNGQVRDVASRAAGQRLIDGLDRYREYAFLERYEAGSADEPGDWFPVGKQQARNPETQTITAAEAERMPIGSFLWADGHGWVVVPGGIAPIALLAERAGRPPPAGEPADIALQFVVVREGNGRVPTHGTAQRAVIDWYQAKRQVPNPHLTLDGNFSIGLGDKGHMHANSGQRQALLDLYLWATRGDRAGNPYSKPEVRAARVALGDPDGYDLPARRPSGKIEGALFDLSLWSTGHERSGNPHSRPEVQAANVALGGDGFTDPEQLTHQENGMDMTANARQNILAVIEAFRAGRAHREATCSTDGETLWSYELPIAIHRAGGVLVLDLSESPSRTTSGQIRAVKAAIPDAVSVSGTLPPGLHARNGDGIAVQVFGRRRSPPWFGRQAHFEYAINIDGIDNDFYDRPLYEQAPGHKAVVAFKESARRDWISAKGKNRLAAVKRWIKSVKPDQFFARWDTEDDSIQMFYTGGHFAPNGLDKHQYPKIDLVEKTVGKEEDTDYYTQQIWDAIYSEAGVDAETFQRALNKVVYEGYYGPGITEEEDEGGLSMREALTIVEAGMGASVDDIEYTDSRYPIEESEPEEGEEFGNSLPNRTVEGSAILDDIFKEIIRIYGSRHGRLR